MDGLAFEMPKIRPNGTVAWPENHDSASGKDQWVTWTCSLGEAGSCGWAQATDYGVGTGTAHFCPAQTTTANSLATPDWDWGSILGSEWWQPIEDTPTSSHTGGQDSIFVPLDVGSTISIESVSAFNPTPDSLGTNADRASGFNIFDLNVSPMVDTTRTSPTRYIHEVVRGREARDPGGYPCRQTTCKKVFDRAGDRRKHEFVHEPESKRRYPCDLCLKAFRYPKDLRRHKSKADHVELSQR